MDNDNMMVSWSAKELLEKLDTKIDGVLAITSNHENRLTVLELDKATKRQARSTLQEIVMTLCTIVVAVGAAVGIGVSIH